MMNRLLENTPRGREVCNLHANSFPEAPKRCKKTNQKVYLWMNWIDSLIDADCSSVSCLSQASSGTEPLFVCLCFCFLWSKLSKRENLFIQFQWSIAAAAAAATLNQDWNRSRFGSLMQNFLLYFSHHTKSCHLCGLFSLILCYVPKKGCVYQSFAQQIIQTWQMLSKVDRVNVCWEQICFRTIWQSERW